MTFGFTFFDQVMTFIAVVSVLGAVFSTHLGHEWRSLGAKGDRHLTKPAPFF
jgi:hypothetical protein